MQLLKFILVVIVLFVVVLLAIQYFKQQRIRRLTDPRRDRVHHRRK